jgi:regulator of chromosome condensation
MQSTPSFLTYCSKIPDSLGKDIVSVSAGLFHSMFLNITGRKIYTCGRCDAGQLGISDTLPEYGAWRERMQPVAFDVEDPDEDLNFKQIAAGDDSCYAVTRTGKLYSWGAGGEGQLGHGTAASKMRPTPVKKFSKEDAGFVLEVASGSQHTIVLANREMFRK